MSRTFLSDFDGTLYFRSGDFRSDDLAAIEAFRSSGGLFGIATGRSLHGIEVPCEGKLTYDLLILASGARIVDGCRRTIYARHIDHELARVAYEAYDARATVVIHAGDTIYNIGHAKYELQTSVSSFAEIEDDIYGLSLLLGSLQEARQTADEINATWGESLVAYQNTRMVDVVPAGCSKGNAVRLVRELLDVDVVAGIGDSFNDIPLLEAADVAYAFTDAPDELRLVATKTVRSAGAALEDFTRRRDG